MDISIQRQAGLAYLRVIDDGHGIAQPYVSGMGITSMRKRAEALGGTFDSLGTAIRWHAHHCNLHGRSLMPIRTLVVDDHIVFREGIRSFLSRVDEIEVVAEAATAEQAVAKAAEYAPDVILMDLHLPDASGTEATAEILSQQPATIVLVLSMHADDKHVRDALLAGARGYLLKDADPDAIARGIVAVHQGQLIFDPGIAQQVLGAATRAGPERPFPSLTDRECEILDRIARGLRNDAIAERMGIALKTVQNHVSTIFLKIGAEIEHMPSR